MIEPQERRWVWIFGALAALVTTLPYLVGFAVQGADWRYSGLTLASEDGYSYLAKMLLGSNGGWLFRTPYTAVPQAGFMAFVPYILLGKLAGGAGRYEQLVALFHWFRIAGVLACTWATYDFFAFFTVDRWARRLGTALALFGGGLGFVGLFGLNGLWRGVMGLPLEFYSPETFGFIALLALPHLAWGRALLLWGLVLLLRGGPRAGLRAGLCWLALGLMQPLTIVSAWAVQAAYLAAWAGWIAWKRVWHWPEWRDAFRRAAAAVVVSAPLVLYNLLAFQLDPFLIRWQARNLIPSPPPGDYLLAYGLLLPLAVLGAWSWRKVLTPARLLPLAWVAVFPLLAYAPHNLQRRLPEGVWAALCVLAVTGMAASSRRWRRLLLLPAGLSFVTTLALFAGALQTTVAPSARLFTPAAETRAMAALYDAASRGAVVLAAYDTSTVLPARAGVRVLIGHGPESLDLEAIRPRVQAFFSPDDTDETRRMLLEDFGVGYVFFGPLERSLGGWDPRQAGFLEEVYRDGEYAVYHVKGAPQ
jgi:hypothetical protein